MFEHCYSVECFVQFNVHSLGLGKFNAKAWLSPDLQHRLCISLVALILRFILTLTNHHHSCGPKSVETTYSPGLKVHATCTAPTSEQPSFHATTIATTTTAAHNGTTARLFEISIFKSLYELVVQLNLVVILLVLYLCVVAAFLEQHFREEAASSGGGGGRERG